MATWAWNCAVTASFSCCKVLSASCRASSLSDGSEDWGSALFWASLSWDNSAAQMGSEMNSKQGKYVTRLLFQYPGYPCGESQQGHSNVLPAALSSSVMAASSSWTRLMFWSLSSATKATCTDTPMMRLASEQLSTGDSADVSVQSTCVSNCSVLSFQTRPSAWICSA